MIFRDQFGTHTKSFGVIKIIIKLDLSVESLKLISNVILERNFFQTLFIIVTIMINFIWWRGNECRQVMGHSKQGIQKHRSWKTF